MIDTLDPGTYVVAVSGGVDSVSLLHVLAQQPHLSLIVAHFDHGIRPDSRADREHVQLLASNWGLPFVYDEVHLGPATSEEAARKARYTFLERVRQASRAQAIITAHHQDDVLETAIHNMRRGTGRRGLTSLASHGPLHRPLLQVPKWKIIDYALEHKLDWHEDSTNADTRYARNYIRHNIVKKLNYEQRAQLLKLIQATLQLNTEIEQLLINQLHVQPAPNRLARHWFIMLPHAVAKEALAQWLRQNGIRSYDKPTLERLVIAGKTALPGKIVDVNGEYQLLVEKSILALKHRDR
ncbi:MAG: hypothetical protein JWS12_249 [Candidatus Saccharibacteria bacterium]|nr:hypothetical protein [Candidatus Saccharibacteria bacterium]